MARRGQKQSMICVGRWWRGDPRLRPAPLPSLGKVVNTSRLKSSRATKPPVWSKDYEP
ncbi:hypothetical protein CCACVL1_19872 [Corchorus capsularis]|uniref:Uncharacterized protein n=1 Tax=Corchorus capsularis TaxID=210143 RepID=A0A1R3HEA0_COCAP|nr:hypothetical protein CCACVL1_19872 [Corchorus capsularis]